MRTVIIYGPQGCGKTTMAEAFRQFFNCTTVVDEASFNSPIVKGFLYLTALSRQQLPLVQGVEIFSYDQVRQMMRDAK